MKVINVPADIVLKDPDTKERFRDARSGIELPPISFRAFAIKVWLNDNRLAETRSELARYATVIEPAFASAKPGGVIRLEDADYAKLLPVVDRPAALATSYGPAFAAQLLPFTDAVVNASEEATNGISAQHAGAGQPDHGREAAQ
jgi:hypothetical protein